MEIRVVTLSNEVYNNSRKLLEDSAKKFGYEIDSYSFSEIENSKFYDENLKIISQKKGLGFWLWKPYIIQKSLEKLKKGDILIYIDAGVLIIDSLAPIIEICNSQSPIMVFENHALDNATWTKRDCFIKMDLDNEAAWKSSQCDASLIVVKKSKESEDFIDEWLFYAKNENAMTDLPNIYGENLPEFIEHRYDQSILSLLAFKHKLHLFRIPSQFGNHNKPSKFRIKGEFNCVSQWNQEQVNYYSHKIDDRSNYPQLLLHHREKNLTTEKEKIKRIDVILKKIKKIIEKF